MKTYKDYLIDFDSLKVGAKVWSTILGKGKIVSLNIERNYPIEVRFGCEVEYYTEKGFENPDYILPSLFKEKPDFYKNDKPIVRWIWHFEYDKEVGIKEDLPKHYTKEEFLSYLKENVGREPERYEKILFTEKEFYE